MDSVSIATASKKTIFYIVSMYFSVIGSLELANNTQPEAAVLYLILQQPQR